MPMTINKPQRYPIIHQPQEGETHSGLGVTLQYKTVGAESDGQFLVLEYFAPPQFGGPPPHWHKVTTEIFYVLEGALTLCVEAETMTVGPGGYAFIPPGIVHTFANQSDTPAKYLLLASPAGLENYFTGLEALIQEEPTWPPADVSKIAALMAKHDTFPLTAV